MTEGPTFAGLSDLNWKISTTRPELGDGAILGVICDWRSFVYMPG
jgi:hypothetical protein